MGKSVALKKSVGILIAAPIYSEARVSGPAHGQLLMREEIFFDLLGQRRLIFDDFAVTHLTDEIYFAVPIPLPFADLILSYWVVTNRPIPYSAIQSIGVVRKRQWWALVMGLIFMPMWLFCLGAGVLPGDWSRSSTWAMAAFGTLWLVLTGFFPLWLFYRGRPFLAIASAREVICFPMDRKKSKVRRAFALLKQHVKSPDVRWEIDHV
jgi:hypothetical protein